MPDLADMGVQLLRPAVSELVFQLFGRPLHPEFFDILAVRKVQREDYDLTVRITRTGHVITWENRSVCLTEVATAADQPLPERRRLLSYRMRGEHSGTLPCARDTSTGDRASAASTTATQYIPPACVPSGAAPI